MRGIGSTLAAVLLVGSACTAAPQEPTTTGTPTTVATTQAETTTTMPETTTTVDPRSVARLDGTWYVTYRVTGNDLEGVGFDDFGGMVEEGDIEGARVWELEHLCDEGVCDVRLLSRRPDEPEAPIGETVLEVRDDGTFTWEPSGEEGFGTCVGDDGSLLEDAFRDLYSIELAVTDVEEADGGWAATALAGTRLREAEPVEAAAAAGCPIRWSTTYQVDAVRTDPDQPVPPLLPPGSEPTPNRIAYVHLGPGQNPDGLWSIGPDGSDPRLVVDLERLQGHAWAPDASRLVYADQEDDLWVVGADGSDPIQIGRGLRPAWSPDGASIAYTRARQDGAGDEVWVTSTLTGETERVTTWAIADAEVAWVDSRRMVVSGVDAGETDPSMRVLDLETGENEGFFFGTAPSVSPDGSQVAFMWDGIIWVANIDTSGLRELTDGPFDDDPTWSPDGAEVSFVRSGSVWVVGADGSDPRRVVEDGVEPGWAPDP